MADPRVTQVTGEFAVEPSDVRPEVSQVHLTLAIMPDAFLRKTQDVIEILHDTPHQKEVSGSITPSGVLTISTGRSSSSDWFNLRVKKLIYLVTLTLRYANGGSIETETIYLSNHPYNTKPSEDPPNTEFIAVLRDEGVPPFRQEMSEIFFGLSIPSYGQLVINNADGLLDDKLPMNRVWEGGDISIKITGDRSELALSEGQVIMRGVLGRPKWSDNTISVEIFSNKRNLEKRNVPTDTMDGVNGEKIFIPELYGYGHNISPILIDEVDLTYKIASSLSAIDAVYDAGVLLSPSQYTTNTAAGEFTLNQAPSGQITADARGRAILGGFSANRADFIYDLLVTFGGIDAVDIDGASFSQFKTLIPGDSGIYLTGQQSINTVIESLLRPVLGYLSFSRSGVAYLGRLTQPVSTDAVALTITNDELVGSGGGDGSISGDIVTSETVDLLIYKVTLRYDQNLTAMDENSIGEADPIDPNTASGMARREWIKNEWRDAIIELAGPTVGRSLYLSASEFGPIDSYFVNQSDANAAAQYWIDIFGINRRIVTVRCKVTPLQTGLHNIIILSYRWTDPDHSGFRWYNGQRFRSISYEENYGDNTVTLGLFA